MSTTFRYGTALVAGLLTTVAGIVAGAAVAGPVPEAGFLGSAVGAILGLSIGGWVTGRLASGDLPSSDVRWLVLLALAPGVWLALFVWTVELRRSGFQSEYFREELLPGLFGILIGLAGAAWGARRTFTGPELPPDLQS